MTIIDAMIDGETHGNIRVVYGWRWLVASKDGDGVLLTVFEQRPRQKHPRCLVQTENEDESVRFLIGEK